MEQPPSIRCIKSSSHTHTHTQVPTRWIGNIFVLWFDGIAADFVGSFYCCSHYCPHSSTTVTHKAYQIARALSGKRCVVAVANSIASQHETIFIWWLYHQFWEQPLHAIECEQERTSVYVCVSNREREKMIKTDAK